MRNPFDLNEDIMEVNNDIWKSYTERAWRRASSGVDEARSALGDPLIGVAHKYVITTKNAVTYLRDLKPEILRKAELADNLEILRMAELRIGLESSEEELLKKAIGYRPRTLGEMLETARDMHPMVTDILDAEEVFVEMGSNTVAYALRRIASKAWEIQNLKH